MPNWKSSELSDKQRRCIPPEERPSPMLRTAEEVADKQAYENEKEMHETFANWCRVSNLPFIHSRMDRKPTIREHWPDYTVINGNRVCLVEFKHGSARPTAGQMEVITELCAQGTPVLVTSNVAEAIHWCREQLHL